MAVVRGKRFFVSHSEFEDAKKFCRGIFPPEIVDRVSSFIEYECYPVSDGYEYTNGTYRGPFQMNRTAWNEVHDKSYVKKYVRGRTVPFEMGVNSTRIATMYACALSIILETYFRAEFKKLHGKPFTGKFTAALMYLCHQQGARGAVKALASGKISNKQSKKSIAMFQKELFDAGVGRMSIV